MKKKESNEKDESLNHEHFTAMTEGTYAQQYYNQVIPKFPTTNGTTSIIRCK